MFINGGYLQIRDSCSHIGCFNDSRKAAKPQWKYYCSSQVTRGYLIVRTYAFTNNQP